MLFEALLHLLGLDLSSTRRGVLFACTHMRSSTCANAGTLPRLSSLMNLAAFPVAHASLLRRFPAAGSPHTSVSFTAPPRRVLSSPSVSPGSCRRQG
jgi:hypothetical protein